MNEDAKPLLDRIVVVRGASNSNQDWWTDQHSVGTLDLESMRAVMSDLGIVVIAGNGPTPYSYRQTSEKYPLLADLNKLWVDPIEYGPDDIPQLVEELSRAISAAETEDERMVLNQLREFAQQEEREGYGLVLL